MRPWRYMGTKPAHPSQRKEGRESQGSQCYLTYYFCTSQATALPVLGNTDPNPSPGPALLPTWKSMTEWRASGLRGQNLSDSWRTGPGPAGGRSRHTRKQPGTPQVQPRAPPTSSWHMGSPCLMRPLSRAQSRLKPVCVQPLG